MDLNRIIIDSRCIETIREFEEYHYAVDRDRNQKSMYPEGQRSLYSCVEAFTREIFMIAGQ